MKYVALLRGINVGGNSLIKMADLKICFEKLGHDNVVTYINSGNVIFESEEESETMLSAEIEKNIASTFKIPVRVVVISKPDYQKIIQNAPKGWGEKEGWKYNTLFLIPPYDVKEITADIGQLKPNIETMQVGEGVIYQAMLFTSFGKTTGGKLASRPSYKKMTVRNWNTSRKLLALLEN